MASFTDKVQGSSDVTWGKMIAGAGMVGGVALVGAGLDLPIISEVTDAAQDLLSSVSGPDILSSKADWVGASVESVTNKIVEISANTSVGDIESEIRTAVGNAAAGHQGSWLGMVENPHWDVIFDKIQESSASNLVSNLEALKNGELANASGIPWDQILETAKNEPFGKAVENIDAVRDTLVKGFQDIPVDKIMKTINNSSPDEVAKNVSEILTTHIDSIGKPGIGTAAAGAAIGGTGAVYLQNHRRETINTTPIDQARLQNAELGFAAKEQMRTANALMNARMAAFGGPAQNAGMTV